MPVAPKDRRFDDGLDDVDRRLVDLLTADARTPNAGLASATGVAPSTVHAA